MKTFILNTTKDLINNESSDILISENLCEAFYKHKCYYLLSKVKNENQYTSLLKERLLLNRLYVSQRFRTCEKLFRDLESDNIPYAVIKGAVLSDILYGNPYTRLSGDVDLLVSHHDIDSVKQLMLNNSFKQGRVTKNGFEPFSRRELLFQSAMSHQLAPFIKVTVSPVCPYVNVDVNFDIMWGESHAKADMNFILSQTERTKICDVPIMKLRPEAEFISLCMHHYKDMNSIYLLAQGSLKLGLFLDIYHYLKNAALNHDHLITLCSQLKVTPYVYYCLHYTTLIFDLDISKTLADKLKTFEGEKLINCFGLSDTERQQWEIGFLDRLFDLDIHEYFRNHLSPELLQKIALNQKFM